eukprot:CAMPEP_0177673182 /NCGR_PEP_ID=MMETSP0447-20121125/25789_1 /TAXON_ID=0 /ORGANISM="Stygamoeba regulata, Strain BSH-02190019" /LENGTH=215 /DNA_ID=CAMNT_0019181001 /DNA_START=73 /DNA_END=720 /DNA_ORIENTATION=+
MAVYTTITRLSDSLPLCASTDTTDQTHQLAKAKRSSEQLLQRLTARSPSEMHVECAPYFFLYSIKGDVCYLTIFEQDYPKKLGWSFLTEISQEFDIRNSSDVARAVRPYHFIKFDTFIQRTRKQYADARSSENMDRVSDDLGEIHQHLTDTIGNLLERGEKLDSVAEKGESLLRGSARFEKYAHDINRSLFRKYAALIVAGVFFFFVVYMWWKWF